MQEIPPAASNLILKGQNIIMNISRRSFLVGATTLLSALASLDLHSKQADGMSTSASPASVTLPPLALRGYGTLSATFRSLQNGQSSLTHITCDSPQKALLVQAKYLSDLGLLPGTEQATTSVSGRVFPVWRTANSGMVACYARGNDVLLFASSSEDRLKEACAAALPLSFAVTDFGARIAVPMWLDRWDKYGFLSYYEPGTPPPNAPNGGSDYDYNADLRFAKDHAMGLVMWTTPLSVDTAEGMTDQQMWSYMQERAKQMGVPIHLNTANGWPVWLGNRYREETQLKAPQFLGGYYGVAHDSGPQGALSWNSQAGEDAMLGVLQETVRRFAPDPNIVGWFEPHGETSDAPERWFIEYGPLADRTMRQFLQERYGSLAVVSHRYHGNASHLKSWSDIHAPEIAEFAGFGPEAIDLRGTWRVKYAAGSTPAEWFQSDFDDSGWDEFVAPGNDRMLTMPRKPLIYRRTIDISADWLAAHPQVTLYVWDMFSIDNKPTDIYVNGQNIPEQSRNTSVFHYGIYDVTHALQVGSNHLALSMPHGIIVYRAYLTGEKPAQYPDLGPSRNARWVDFINWTLWFRKAGIARGVEMIRQFDPNRSINIAAVEFYSPFKIIAQEYGCRFHDTGGMAGFWNESPAFMGAGSRLPTTAEPGSPAGDPAQFQAFWGRWITEGLNGVHYFQRLGDIMHNPEILKTFEANRRMYQAIGKYHAPFAEVGILCSTVNGQLAGFPWDASVTDKFGGSGYFSNFNAGSVLLDYCPRAGVTEDDFGTPNVNNFRMIVDTNTNFMSDTLISGIETYVRNGGIFVTNGQTGRHDDVHPDTWPISRLTGYHVITPNVGGLTASPAPGQTVFTGLEWDKPVAGGGQSLKKVALECQDLLLWSDGTTAIGMRPLGKGWIVNAGASINDLLVIRQIVAHFGIKRIPATYAPAPGLHFRHFIANTGLQDIWVLFNETPTAVTTSLTFPPGVHPASMTDIITHGALEITRGDSGDTVPNIALHPWQMVMYVSPRADIAASPLEWLELQRGWWAGTKTPPAKHLPTLAEQQRFTLDITDDWAFKQIDGATDDQANALVLPTLDDHAWERRNLEQWLDPGPPKPQRLVLRRTFTVPLHWTAGTVLFCNEVVGGAFFLEARTFIDGKPLYDGRWLGNGPNYNPLGGMLKPGSTHHVAFDIRSASTLIGARCPCWLTYEPDPLDKQDLAGQWTGYSDEIHALGPVQLPGVVKGVAYLSRSVEIDSAHRGRNVVVYASVPDGMITGLLINGQRLDPARVGYERHDLIIDITPMVNFGKENTIEFAFAYPNSYTIEAVEIRYYEKGYYP